MSGDDVPPRGAGPDRLSQKQKQRLKEDIYDTAPLHFFEGGDEPSMANLLLLSHSPAHPITGAEA